MIITAKALKDIGACHFGVTKFRRYFGEGGEVTLEKARLWHRLGGEGFAKAVCLLHKDAQRRYDADVYIYGGYDKRPERFMRAVELHDKIMLQMG